MSSSHNIDFSLEGLIQLDKHLRTLNFSLDGLYNLV